MMVMIETPDGSTTAATQALVEKVEAYLMTEEAETVESTFSVLGFSFSGAGQNNAMLFAKLRDYADRPGLDVAS
ncbi:efflux RND transporter permease subunit, partial [Shigella sonnei]|uniref:efflux RND transporter permease subunit n=1 Tax=Shigella sonnei TaxID=624 RepID=UPI0020A63F20